MPSIAILHAPKDQALGDKIAAALSSAGLASSRLESGQAGDPDGAAIVVWTETAAKLAQLHEQALSAMARGALVPVAIGGALPPDEFENLPPVDLSGWTGSSDDPRWRFVLEEIQLTKQRLGLRDGVVWNAAEQETDTVDRETENDLEISAQLKRALPSNDAPPAFLAPGRSHRRFSAKEVAIGATAGLVAMTIATALLAPVLLPAPQPVQQTAATQTTPDAQIPDPSQQSPSALASLSVPGAETDAPFTDDATTASETSVPVLDSAASNRDAIKDLIAAVDAETMATEPAAAAPEPVAAQAVVGDAFKVNTFKDCAQCPEMASLPAGSYQMGAAPGETAKAKSESPRRQVAISKSFALGTREITYAQWDACVADGGCTTAPSDHGWGRGDRPVVSVSFDDALSYAAWLSKKTGQSYRLPSEAEWEFAARAGSDAAFATGAGISTAQANYNGQFPYRGAKEIFRQRTVPVASFPANAFGLFDMHGNAWEWTSDCWKASHAGAPADQSAIADGDCAKRVLKGGAWNTGAWRLRSAHRIGKARTAREFDNGFRVAKDLGP